MIDITVSINEAGWRPMRVVPAAIVYLLPLICISGDRA